MKYTIKESQLNRIIKESIDNILHGDADGGYSNRLNKIFNELSSYLKHHNTNAYNYLMNNKNKDGIVEEMYAMYKEGLF